MLLQFIEALIPFSMCDVPFISKGLEGIWSYNKFFSISKGYTLELILVLKVVRYPSLGIGLQANQAVHEQLKARLGLFIKWAELK